MTPSPIVLNNSAPTRRMPLIMLLPLTLALAIGAGLYLNGTPLEEIILPVGAMIAISLGLGLIMAIFALVMTLIERASINSVLRDQWAAFPQFPDEREWRAYAERERDQKLKNVGFPWASLIVVIVVFGFVTGFSIIQLKAPPAIFYGIGALVLIVLTIMFGGNIMTRMNIHSEYRRRMKMPPPTAYVGKWGLYDEDKGYESLRHLKSVRYLETGAPLGSVLGEFDLRSGSLERGEQAGWGMVLFRVKRPRHGRSYFAMYETVVGARVPPGCEGDAQALVERFHRERL